MKKFSRSLLLVGLSLGLAAAGRAAGFEELAANLWSTTFAAMRLQRPAQIPAALREAPSAADRIVEITIAGDAFSPAAVTIAKGDWIRWTNKDDEAHTATGKGRSFDTGTLMAGRNGQVRFKKEGTFPYFCAYHPMMTGRIVVQ
jgi:plastocyanin